MKEQSIPISQFVKYFYFISGFILVGVGVSRNFFTAFAHNYFSDLASICFLKSSPRANEWLRNHKILGAYIDNYQNKTGLTRNAKIANIITLWASISLSAFLLTDEFYIRIILFVIAIGVTVHIILIKTKQTRL